MPFKIRIVQLCRARLIDILQTVPHYFIKSRALALGITVSGSSLGGVIWPITLKNVLYKINFGWGVRIAAFIMLPLLGLACLSIRLPETSHSKAKPKPDTSVLKHPVLILLAVGLFFIYLGLFSPFFYITSWTISLGLDANMAFYSSSSHPPISLPLKPFSPFHLPPLPRTTH